MISEMRHWGNDIVYTFAGAEWAALRDDQKQYVQHLMQSWRAVAPWGYNQHTLRRAIRKAKQNLA